MVLSGSLFGKHYYAAFTISIKTEKIFPSSLCRAFLPHLIPLLYKVKFLHRFTLCNHNQSVCTLIVTQLRNMLVHWHLAGGNKISEAFKIEILRIKTR